ncbi:MAG: mucoidy inhibitor MuiA family protein [Bacteroidia bacterium]|nr:mucoidy inhibitor MuiA family protein [Bacteroidia bacterium]
MKKLFLTLILLSTVVLYISADTEKDIKAGLKHVTVYPDRAQMTHEATVEIAAGKTMLKLGGLSPYIDAQSIQVKGYGEFMILSVNHQNNYLQNLDEIPEIKSIRSQIEELQIKVEDEKAAISVLNEKKDFLVSNKAILVAKQTAATPEQLKSMMDLYTASMEQITTTIIKNNRQVKEYEKQIAALQNQINDKAGKAQLPSGEISVSVNSDKPVSGKLTLSYVVSNAGWYPSYDIRVDDITKPVNIFYKANVFQNSGVDWKDVKLSFSNATPWIAGDVPTLYPWFIDYYVPIVYNVMKSRTAGIKSEAPAMAEVSLDREMAKVEEAAPIAVEKQVGETTITFDIAIPYSVVSDGKVQTIEIQRTNTAAGYKYVTVPKISSLAYLTANITDWAKQSLQSGEATLYFENTFVGKSYLNVNQLSDTLTLSLGTDNSILVKREKRKDFTSKKIIGANTTEIYSFLTTIRNNKATAIRITMNDQLPVSSNSGITVESLELSGGRFNSQTGQVKWDLDIKPQETKQIVLTYSVKYPKDKKVILE